MIRFIPRRHHPPVLILACLAVGALLLAPTPGPPIRPAPAASPGQAPVADHARPPLAFEPNAGQTDPAVRFLAHSPGATLFFTPDGVVLALRNPQSAGQDAPSSAGNVSIQPATFRPPHAAAPVPPQVVRMGFVGAAVAPMLDGSDGLPGQVSYFLGNDPAQWHAGLPTYADLTYSGLYPGIDLRYSGTSGQLKGTYTVAAGADPARIRWRYDGAASVQLDGAGNLQILIGGDECDRLIVTERAPTAWQQIGGQQAAVAARYTLAADGSLGFALGPFEPAQPLIIDPYLYYATYLGGFSADLAKGLVADAAGNAYVGGYTASSNFPTINAYQPIAPGQGDAFVVRFAPDGTPLYSTYLGGSYLDFGSKIAVDSGGNVYVTGWTGSANFPVLNAAQPTYAGTWDAFVTKLNPGGSALVYSTYLGGSGQENYHTPGAIAVDAAGSAYVVGDTQSTDFPTVNPFQPNLRGSLDAFVTKLSPSGSAFVYSTYFGGAQGQGGGAFGVAVDSLGQATFTGDTTDWDFPVANAYQPACHPGFAGCWDAFLSRLNAQGSGLVYSTYLGGNDQDSVDQAHAVAVDPAGNAVMTGFTGSPNFPTFDALQPTYAGQIDVFVSKFTPLGGLIFSTFLGGENADIGGAVALDSLGGITVGGQTLSEFFPTTNAIQPTIGGFEDAFITRFALDAHSLQFSTYLGGTDNREEYGVVGLGYDSQDNLYLASSSSATDFPVINAYQPTNHGSYDAIIARISGNPPPSPTPSTVTPSATPTACATNYGISTATGVALVPGATDSGNHCEDCVTSVTLPFPYRLYGQTYSTINVSDNGNLQFQGSETWSNPGCLPSTVHGPTIFAYWYNLLTNQTGQGIFTSVSGSAPNRVFNVEWRACTYYNGGCGGSVNFEIRLYEGQTAFDIVYGTMVYNGQYVTVGVQAGPNVDGPHTQYLCDSAGGLTAGLKLSFVLPPCSTATPGPPSPTHTPVVPTATRTATSPPVPPSATRTSMPGTPSSTPVPPNATPTSSPVPPSATRTARGTVVPPSATPTVLLPPTASATPCALTFTDVPASDPFYGYIRCLVCRGIVSGYTTSPPCSTGTPCFLPGAAVTRGQATKMAANAAGFQENHTDVLYTDVPTTHPFYQYIMRLSDRGFVSGYTDTATSHPCAAAGVGSPCFLSYANVTRGQLAKIDANTAGYAETFPATQQSFSDVPYANGFWVYVERVKLHGAISGYSDTPTSHPCAAAGVGSPCFLWANHATRGQTSKIVANTFYPACNTP